MCGGYRNLLQINKYYGPQNWGILCGKNKKRAVQILEQLPWYAWYFWIKLHISIPNKCRSVRHMKKGKDVEVMVLQQLISKIKIKIYICI
jgi:hypothetical protein